MRLRDRLAQLSSPASVGSRARIRGDALGDARPDGNTRGTQGSGAHDAPRMPMLELPGDDRAARIAQLRSLIGEVAAREGRARARASRGLTESDEGGAPQHTRERHSPSLPMGALQQGPHGELRVLERLLEPQHCHGRVPVRDALRVEPAHVAALAHDRALASVKLRDLLILDTETTGLSGGTGTVPFLIGLSWFEGGDDDPLQPGGEPVLRVEQLFLENLGQEAPLLHRLAERIARASMLVTYNGKAFDWPLLRTRFVLSRIPVPALPPHLDLLHCARRLWSSRLPSVRLTEVERSVLGLFRHDDVDGSEIPGLYLGYLRGGDPSVLAPVLQHNEHDLVALAALLGRMGRLYGAGDATDARDLLACALLALRAHDPERAIRYAEHAADEAEGAAQRVRALLLCGRLHARGGDRARAIARYERALEESGESCGRSSGQGSREHTSELAATHLALSRLYERDRDLTRAYSHARQSEPAESPLAHGRRLGRLRRRWLGASR